MSRERWDKEGTLSPVLVKRLEELDSLRKRKPRPHQPAKSAVLAIYTHLRLLLHCSVSPAFHLIRLFPAQCSQSLSARVAQTHCAHCGQRALRLLTRSRKGRESPTLREKVRGIALPEENGPIAIATQFVPRQPVEATDELESLSVIPFETVDSHYDERWSPLLPESESKRKQQKSTWLRLAAGLEKTQRAVNRVLQSVFDILYVAQLPKSRKEWKEQSLAVEFSIERLDAVKHQRLASLSALEAQGLLKLQDSFASDNQLFKSSELCGESVLTASNSAAVLLLTSRLEKIISRRLMQLFERLSVS